MTDTEQLLRDALRARAEQLTESDLQPAVLPSAAPEPGSPRGRSRWAWPALAAAAIVALAVAGVVVHDATQGAAGPVARPTPTVPTLPTLPTFPTHTSTPGTRALPTMDAAASDASERGRAFDVVKPIGWNGKGGVGLVLFVRRLRVYGVSDAQIAQHGIAVKPHTDDPYTGVGKTVYAVPVAPGATFTLNVCASSPSGVPSRLVSRQMTGAQFVNRIRYVSGLVIAFDAQGRATSVQTDGGCQ